MVSVFNTNRGLCAGVAGVFNWTGDLFSSQQVTIQMHKMRNLKKKTFSAEQLTTCTNVLCFSYQISGNFCTKKIEMQSNIAKLMTVLYGNNN